MSADSEYNSVDSKYITVVRGRNIKDAWLFSQFGLSPWGRRISSAWPYVYQDDFYYVRPEDELAERASRVVFVWRPLENGVGMTAGEFEEMVRSDPLTQGMTDDEISNSPNFMFLMSITDEAPSLNEWKFKKWDWDSFLTTFRS